jgi:hypothetical protein
MIGKFHENFTARCAATGERRRPLGYGLRITFIRFGSFL